MLVVAGATTKPLISPPTRTRGEKKIGFPCEKIAVENTAAHSVDDDLYLSVMRCARRAENDDGGWCVVCGCTLTGNERGWWTDMTDLKTLEPSRG